MIKSTSINCNLLVCSVLPLVVSLGYVLCFSAFHPLLELLLHVDVHNAHEDSVILLIRLFLSKVMKSSAKILFK
jgi:hypothetical protein